MHKFPPNDSFIVHLDLTEELNFVRMCGQEKRNLGYCDLIIFSLYTWISPVNNGQEIHDVAKLL